MSELNFGYSPEETVKTAEEQKETKTDISGGNDQVDENGNPISKIDEHKETTDTTKREETDTTKETKQEEEKPHDLVSGTKLEIGDKTYTVDDNGNVIDDKGEIFKEAKDVKEWLNEFEQSEEDATKQLTIANISKALDLEIVDEEGKPIQYEDSLEGITAYVKDAIETGKEEVVEATVNHLYSQFPFIKPMIDYYVANGNSLEGYNEVPDRSGIEIDTNDVAQQEAIIKMAWKENGRKGNVDSYIDYLKSSNTLLDVAKEELLALKESDRLQREKLEKDAQAAEKQRLEESNAYWGKVKSVIEKKTVAGYTLPDNIIIERDGKKTTATLVDFYRYIAQNDKDGLTAYARDLMADSADSRLEDDILRAYLKFTGGTYSNLVDMAINEQKVKHLQLRAKENRKESIRITTPKKQTKVDTNDFGY